MMITVPYFFYEIQMFYRASTLRRWQLRKKPTCYSIFPVFSKTDLLHEKIPLLLTHSFLIIIPLLQRNDAYWIMYLKKERKNTQKDDCHNPQKIETIYRWFTLCLLQNYYTLLPQAFFTNYVLTVTLEVRNM